MCVRVFVAQIAMLSGLSAEDLQALQQEHGMSDDQIEAIRAVQEQFRQAQASNSTAPLKPLLPATGHAPPASGHAPSAAVGPPVATAAVPYASEEQLECVCVLL